MKLVNLSNDTVIADQVEEAYSFFKRLKGLLFTENLDSGTGLHIKPCQSVHTFFMKYAIDVVYLDKQGTVVAVDEIMEPGKAGRRRKGAVEVVELPAGTVKATDTQPGHQFKFI